MQVVAYRCSGLVNLEMPATLLWLSGNPFHELFCKSQLQVLKWNKAVTNIIDIMHKL
jgi:hypothetical protein